VPHPRAFFKESRTKTGDGGPVLPASIADPSGPGILSSLPAISQDGTTIRFAHRNDANLIPRCVQVHTIGGATIDSAGATSPGAFDRLAISGDGRHASFLNGSAPRTEIWRFAAQTAGFTEVSVSSFGAKGNLNDLNVAVSAAGRRTAWDSASSNLTEGDPHGRSDVFVRGPLR
jgi:hypothetical protein